VKARFVNDCYKNIGSQRGHNYSTVLTALAACLPALFVPATGFEVDFY